MTDEKIKSKYLKKVDLVLQDFSVADGFVGFTEEEWNGVKKFIPFLWKCIKVRFCD